MVREGRDATPREIERTVGIDAAEVDDAEAYLDAGASHLIVMTGPPFDLDPVSGCSNWHRPDPAVACGT